MVSRKVKTCIQITIIYLETNLFCCLSGEVCITFIFTEGQLEKKPANAKTEKSHVHIIDFVCYKSYKIVSLHLELNTNNNTFQRNKTHDLLVHTLDPEAKILYPWWSPISKWEKITKMNLNYPMVFVFESILLAKQAIFFITITCLL